MSASAESLALLRSIDASLKQLLAALAPQSATNDRLCDGPYGDPVVNAKDPRDWTGEPMKGKRFSECPPEYLDMMAERFDYFASKEEDAKKQAYKVKDAQRARAWAARLRNGWTRPEADAPMRDAEPRW